MADRRFSRYGRYRGGPDPLAPPVDLAEALEAIGEDVMAGYSPERALSEFLRRGGSDHRGLDDLARRVAERRRELTRRHNLDGTLEEIRELLDRAVLQERKQLARDLDDDARFAEMQMAELPASAAAKVAELNTYNWRSAQARQDFEKVKDLLGREMLDQRFAGMKQALENATDDDRAAVKEMLDDLNSLLAAHGRGEDTTEQFDEFMAKHGDFFTDPDGHRPSNVEELIDALAQRAAAAQRMRNSLTAEQRAELDALAAQAFGTPELMQSLSQLDANLQALRPGEDWYSSEDFDGQEGMGLGEAAGVMQEIADLDSLADQLSQAYAGARLDDVDLEALARTLGEDAAVDAQRLKELERALHESGYVKNAGDGALRLSPKAIRQLGKALLRDVAERMSGRSGQRDMQNRGASGERSGASREWQFGDTEPWDVTRTINNAVLRTVSEGGDPRSGVQLRIEDVEVTETEARTQAAVALLVDTSFSMAMDGRWVPMKRTALALHTLISTRFRGDSLQMIGFGRYARAMEIEELTGLDPFYDKGTNLHHALLLAKRHFRKHPSAQPVLLIVTDGEPTSHLERDGQVFFNYPPHPGTLARTVAALDDLGRLGAQTTFFRLGEDIGLARFIAQMAARVDGRVVAPELDDLGVAVVDSYLSGRTAGRSPFGGGQAFGGGPGFSGWGGRGWWAG